MSSENDSDFTGDDTKFPRSKLAFDFVVQEKKKKPVYIPNSGPRLLPISLIPPHKLKGIVLDCFPYPKPNDPDHFLVGYEKEPNIQLIIHPKNIRNYVSAYTLENWEYERSTAEEERAIAELQPRLIAAERARQLRELKKVGLSRDALKGENAEQYQVAMPRGRGRPPKSMASVFRPEPRPEPKPAHDLPGGKRRPGRPRKTVEVHVTSPTISHHHQPSFSQPSLSQPSLSQSQSFSTASRAMVEHAIADSESEEEYDDAVNFQLNEESNQLSSSTNKSPTVLRNSSPISKDSTQDQITKTPIQSPQKNKSFKKSPHNRPQRAPILPGMSVNEYPYKKWNIDAYKENKSIKAEASSSIHNPSQSSLQQLPILPVQNGKQPANSTFQGINQRPQTKIHDYFNDSSTKTSTPKMVAANRYKPTSGLKRKSSPSLGPQAESSGKPRSKSRKLDYLDADYEDPTMKKREPSYDPSPSIRRGSDAFNLRSSRSRSRRLESPDDEDGEENEAPGEDNDEEDDLEDFDDEPPTWAVKAILNHKYEWNENHDKQVLWYFVDWEGDWDPSWEPATLVSNGAIEEYIASRRAKGLGDLSISIDAMNIGMNGREVSRGDDLERSIENDG